MSVSPDVTVINVTLQGICPDYSETLRRSSEETETLQDLFCGFGFKKKDLKTLSFDVNTQYEGYHENGEYKQRFVGYRFCHTLKVEFGSDNDKLGRILYALANSPVNPEFAISYTVRDKEKPKAELIAGAIEDARIKAGVIASSAGVSLGCILRIEYCSGNLSFEVAPMRKMYASNESNSLNSFDMNINPDDIEISETVTVVWTID